MPYKVVGKSVMVQKGGKWHVLHTHENHAKALKHLAALEINVEGHGRPKKKRKP